MALNGLGRSQVFVISRPDDAGGWRQRIEADLRSRGILASKVSDAQAVVVIVGPRFLAGPQSPRGSRGNDRIGPYKQIGQALSTTKVIIPILVDGARMPESRTLPRDIQPFSYRQALVIESEGDLPGVMARVISASRAAAATRGSERVAGQPEASVFISYRRDDTSFWASMLARSLALELGPEAVFFDEGSERPGLDFRAQFEDFLYQCTDVVIVIGSGFLESDARGRRRIDRPEDYVRREIRTALSLRKRIHPVLVGQAQMPTREQLPDDIAGLAVYPAIHRLSSREDIDGIKNGILRLGIRPVAGLSFLRPRVSGVSAYLRKPDYKARATAVREELAQYGWHAVKEPTDPQKETVLLNDRFPDYRMVLQVGLAELALEERERSALSLGLSRWARRAIFPISPYTPDDLDVFRLPDRLLEAALDPGQFLDRGDRVDLKKGKQPPMRSDQLFKTIQDFVEPNATAIEKYQHLQRRLASRGKPARLVHEGDIKLPAGANPRVIAISSDGDAVVVGTDHGLFRLSGQDWRVTTMKGRGSYQSVDISPAGHIAACSDDNDISLWNASGSVMAKSISPHSWWRKVSADPWIKSLSWSPSGNLLACCDKEAIWIYATAKNEFIRWKYPAEQERNSEYGLKFAPNGRELVVYAYGTILWVLDASTGTVRKSIELPSRPLNLSWQSSEPRERPEGPAFYDFNDIDLSPRGDILACAGSDGQIMLIDYATLGIQEIIVGHEPLHNGFWTRIAKIAFSHDGRRLASLGSDNHLVVWETTSWEPVGEAIVSWPLVLSGRRVIAWYPDGSRIVGCAGEGTLEVWRL